ncbi:MAG: trypsin-like peptidase domain-containing protein, partial [Armatimonadota bacterium]|nr:trypsin-like peptidase domain-containing protein [Armatimonadota bacterium]
GLVLTNAHVVRGDASPSITLADGRTVTGRVLGRDEEADLALVQIEVTGIPPIVWGDSDALRPGERLLAIGYPLGGSVFRGGEASVTSGIFSAHRDLRGRSFIQTDTPLNPGNSGGPLINLKGEVIGINTLVVGRTSELQAQGLNLAIPSNVARPLIPVLRAGGR